MVHRWQDSDLECGCQLLWLVPELAASGCLGLRAVPGSYAWEPAGWVAAGLQRSLPKLPGFLALNFALNSQWCQS